MSTVADLLTAIGYRLFPSGDTLSSSTEPTQTECIQWINEVCEELLTVCAENRSELGRTVGSITLSDGTASYNDLASLLFSPCLMWTSEGKSFSGWIEKTNVRNPLTLAVEGDLIDSDPALESEPDSFYIDGSNNLIFIPTPDATYTAKIPYYPYHTKLTLTTDTVPFKKIFDNVIIESVTMKAQNRDEFDLSFELKWFSYIRSQARKIIYIRRNETKKIVT